jgi:hypothetical protein
MEEPSAHLSNLIDKVNKLWGKIRMKKENKRKLFDFIEIGSNYTSSDSEKR